MEAFLWHLSKASTRSFGWKVIGWKTFDNDLKERLRNVSISDSFYGQIARYQESVIIYDQDGGGRDMGGGLEKYSIQRGVMKKFSILERDPETFSVLQSPRIPGGGAHPWSDFILLYLYSASVC